VDQADIKYKAKQRVYVLNQFSWRSTHKYFPSRVPTISTGDTDMDSELYQVVIDMTHYDHDKRLTLSDARSRLEDLLEWAV